MKLHDGPFEFARNGRRKTFRLQRFVCDACEEDFVDDHAAKAVELELRRWAT